MKGMTAMIALLSLKHNDLKKKLSLRVVVKKLPSLNFQAAFLLSAYLLSFACFVPSLPCSHFFPFCLHTLFLQKNPMGRGNEH